MHDVEFQTMIHEIKNAAQPLYRLSLGHLTEAMAVGLGFQGRNGMRAARGTFERLFSERSFISRLTKLTNPLTARATAALFDGYRATITMAKKPESFLDRETVYSITIAVAPPQGRSMPAFVGFRLPEFFDDTGAEKYRVDADYTHRVDGPDAVTRKREGRKLLDTRLIDGGWSGALYVYDPKQRVAPEGCLGTVRSALARTILAQFAALVGIDVFRPDTYDFGAWRVLMRAGHRVREVFPDGIFRFALPTLSTERFIIGQYDRQHQPLPGEGQFVDGSFAIDVHSNGVAEEDNPVPMEVVRDAFLQAVHARLESAGIAV